MNNDNIDSLSLKYLHVSTQVVPVWRQSCCCLPDPELPQFLRRDRPFGRQVYITYFIDTLFDSKWREEFKLFCFVCSCSWCACVAGACSPWSCVLHLLVQEVRRAGSSALLQPQATLPCLRNDGLEWGKSKLENVYFTTWWRLDALLTVPDLPMAEHRNQVSK